MGKFMSEGKVEGVLEGTCEGIFKERVDGIFEESITMFFDECKEGASDNLNICTFDREDDKMFDH